VKQTAVKLISIGAVVAALCGVASSAAASQIEKRYDVVLPAFQIPEYTPADTNTQTNVDGWINVTFIGASYKENAQMCSLGGAYCGGGTKMHDIYRLAPHDDADLPNSYAKGTKLVTSLTTSSFVHTSVVAQGYWCAY
jgi:hypothetical protein